MTDDARAETLLFQLLEGEITAESLDAADRAAIAALDGRHAAETLRGAALLSQLLGPSPWRERDADPDALAGELAAKRAGLAEAERVERGLTHAGSTAADIGDAMIPLLLAAPAAPRAYADDARSAAAGLLLPSERHVMLEETDLRLTLSREGARLVLALFAAAGPELHQLEVALDGVPLSPSEITASAIVYQVGALTALSGAELSVRLGTRWLRTFRLILVGG
ncbi:MAG: hypothetical protein KC503_23695 [Myxococcales bacterium]|nr:hypothetical protein [Myxococcales bacterium]